MYLLCDVTSDDRIIEKVCKNKGWVLLVLCNYTDKSCNHKHCNGGDIIFLICHVTPRGHKFKGLCEFMCRSLPR